MGSQRFQTLIFDLDDTLIPTSEILIPRAVRQVFEILQQHGLGWSFEDFEKYRKRHMKNLSHREIFNSLIAENFLKPKEHIFERCLRAFYQPDLPEALPLLPGARENMESLGQKYQLFVLTAGDASTQKKKILKADLEKFFFRIGIADLSLSLSKQKILEAWIAEKIIQPDQSLSIGNRLNDEIRASKSLGLSTCYFRFGEHANEIPENILEQPDFTITHHLELVPICQL